MKAFWAFAVHFKPEADLLLESLESGDLLPRSRAGSIARSSDSLASLGSSSMSRSASRSAAPPVQRSNSALDPAAARFE